MAEKQSKSLIVYFGSFQFKRIKQGNLSDKQFDLVILNSRSFGVSGLYADLPREQFLDIWAKEAREDYAEAFDSMPTVTLSK